jgi:diaminopropionate ammonia-lyase
MRLPHLATKLGVAELLIKDESQRLGLGSFKALGGAFAVLNLVGRAWPIVARPANQH